MIGSLLLTKTVGDPMGNGTANDQMELPEPDIN